MDFQIRDDRYHKGGQSSYEWQYSSLDQADILNQFSHAGELVLVFLWKGNGFKDLAVDKALR